MTVPTSAQFVDAFLSLNRVSDAQISMLRFHYAAERRTVTATQMATAANYSHYGVANLQYGRLGRRIGESLSFLPTDMPVDVLVTQSRPANEWLWTMRPQVAEALEILNWVEGDTTLPDEEPAAITFIEGAIRTINVNAFERDRGARRRCLELHGYCCCICGIDFGAVYGPIANGFIHVHHLRPLSEIQKEYYVDPLHDLRPVCPNCHAVLHMRNPPFTVDELIAMLATHKELTNNPIQEIGGVE